MAKNVPSSKSKKRKKKRATNRKQTVISILIILAVIAFVLPDLMPFIMPSGPKRSNVPSSTNIPPANPSTAPAEPTFTKESELTIISSETGKAIKTLDIELADDPAQREQGLMYRRSMKDEQGMLFLFDRPAPQSFWMRNTYIPLDIIYVDENKKITTIHPNTTPLSEVSLPSDGDAQFVLEVNGGWCMRYGVKVGDVLEW